MNNLSYLMDNLSIVEIENYLNKRKITKIFDDFKYEHIDQLYKEYFNGVKFVYVKCLVTEFPLREYNYKLVNGSLVGFTIVYKGDIKCLAVYEKINNKYVLMVTEEEFNKWKQKLLPIIIKQFLIRE
jgi:uncharacterized membrane protein